MNEKKLNTYWNARLTVNLSLSLNLLAGSQERKKPRAHKKCLDAHNSLLLVFQH